MTDDDYPKFERAFWRVCGAFRLRLTVAERTELTKTYFKVLDPFPLDDVLRIGRVVLEKFKKFPTLAEWLTELGARPENVSAVDVRQMTMTELDTLAQAEALRYRDTPCDCLDCVRAEVSHQQIRFVPSLIDNGEEERAWHPQRKRTEVVGHWAHGLELARYYKAKADFYNAYYQALQSVSGRKADCDVRRESSTTGPAEGLVSTMRRILREGAKGTISKGTPAKTTGSRASGTQAAVATKLEGQEP